MENDREARELLLNLMKDIKSQRRRNQTAGLRVPGALLGFELIGTMGSSDGDCERIAAGLAGEVDDFLRTGVVRLLCGNLILYSGQDTKLSLNGNIILVGVLDNLLRKSDILIIWESGTVDHH